MRAISSRVGCIHQISHLFFGFIGEPTGHRNSLENASKFDRVPITRNCGGACGSFSISKLVVSSVIVEHHT